MHPPLLKGVCFLVRSINNATVRTLQGTHFKSARGLFNARGHINIYDKTHLRKGTVYGTLTTFSTDNKITQV